VPSSLLWEVFMQKTVGKLASERAITLRCTRLLPLRQKMKHTRFEEDMDKVTVGTNGTQKYMIKA